MVLNPTLFDIVALTFGTYPHGIGRKLFNPCGYINDMDLRFPTDNEDALSAICQSPYASADVFFRHLAADKAAVGHSAELNASFQNAANATFRLLDHQKRVVRRVLHDMGGLAILADEVGLGKTIEAGATLKSLADRGLVRRSLILVPATLVSQWCSELSSAFGIHAHPLTSAASHDVPETGCTVVSIDRAKGRGLADRLRDRPWDLIIVDEAHRLKNRSTLNWRFVSSLQRTYMLLLTATPIQNDLRDIYNLVTLLKPGQLSTFDKFKRYFMLDRFRVKNTDGLQEALAEVMVRTTRRDARLSIPPRHVETYVLTPEKEESRFYDAAVAVLQWARRRKEAENPGGPGKAGRLNLLTAVQLLRMTCSHHETAASRLDELADEMARDEASAPLMQASNVSPSFFQTLAARIQSSKMMKLLELLVAPRRPVVVFTQFRRTQKVIVRALDALQRPVFAFHGGLNRASRTDVLRRFQQAGGVLVSTDAGSEGVNMQWADTVINFDLPWNPMIVEQRIGRVHRIGQTHGVRVANFVLQGTVEDRVLALLQKKLGLFHKVIGEMDALLARVEGGFQKRLAHNVFDATDAHDLEHRFATLGIELEGHRRAEEETHRAAAGWLDGDGVL